MDSQREFFGEFPQSVNPSSNFGRVRDVEQNKIIQYPVSVWKDGRMRADLSAFGAGEVVSRNEKNFLEKVIRKLQAKLNTAIVEVVSDVSEELRREHARPPSRIRKKEIGGELSADLVYANPFAETQSGHFVMCPDWIAARKDLKDSEKLIYGRLCFPLGLCKSWDKELGVITGLDQEKLGGSLGRSRQWANHWLISMELKRWLECTGPPGAKKDKLIRFFWKDGMPETCHTSWQVLAAKPATRHGGTCHTSEQKPATRQSGTCRTSEQVSEGIENREYRREERKGKGSSFYDW